MERPPPQGSVRRARELAGAGISREERSFPRTMSSRVDEEPQIARPTMATTGQSRIPRQQAQTGAQTWEGQIGVAISRPAQSQQWPLPVQQAPIASLAEPYRPPAGRAQPPQRPPRPSRGPSILDDPRLQASTQLRPPSGRDSSGIELLSVPETPSSNMSRPSTLSSVGTIPDFPLPGQLPPGPPRRSVGLGPPPSARRGASSFYSNASFVSPIPEESPRSRSHASYASSAAMPESWGSVSPGPSPNYPDTYFDDTIAEETGQSVYGDDDAEEIRLVRNASIGKRAKPTLVTGSAPRVVDEAQRPMPAPIQPNEPFKHGTGYVENSNSSSMMPTTKTPIGSAVTADVILNAYNSASANDPSSPSQTPSPQLPGGRGYSRLSAIRRPPRLDIDAVRKAESRGSLTSLPDLIRRATRLAASLENGRRPASRFDDFADDYNRDKDVSFDGEKHQSGLSDMLAAFPPPVQPSNQRRSFRDSVRDHVQSWPLPFAGGANRTPPNNSQEAIPNDGTASRRTGNSGQKRRRWCGLPMWAFIVVMIVILMLIAAAIAVPLEFFVIRRQNAERQAEQALGQCRTQLRCANGGTNVVSQGACSCICANGFTGADCTVQGTAGCTTITLAGTDEITNVTVGQAIPRLIQQAQSNFSVPLDGRKILAKLNAGNLSCTAMNALVTFDGRSVRQGDALAQVVDVNSDALDSGSVAQAAEVINGVAYLTITILIGQSTTLTITPAWATQTVGFSTLITAPATPTTTAFTTTIGRTSSARSTTTTAAACCGGGSGGDGSDSSSTQTPTSTWTTTTTVTMSNTQAPGAEPTFMVTEEVLDFARVAILYVLQEENLANAEQAQLNMQTFFTKASKGATGGSDNSAGVTVNEARDLDVGDDNTVNLADFTIDVGGEDGTVGGRPASSSSRVRRRLFGPGDTKNT